MTMRVGSLARRVAIAVTAAGTVAVGCSATKPTELVPGIMTQLQLPRDLQAIRLDLLANGATVFCRSYQAVNGVVTLPSTLGVVSQSSPNTTVTVTVGGYDAQGATGQEINDCQRVQEVNPASPDAPRVVRRSVQTYVAGHTLFIPMPISFSCFDQDCAAMGTDYSCKGGSCVKDPPPQVTASGLVDFTPSLIDGTDACFDWKTCFPPSVSTAAWTATPTSTDCVYTAQMGTPGGSGLNVRVFYQEEEWAKSTVTGEYELSVVDGGEDEILDQDPVEGFTLVSPASSTSPVQFKLAPGLCQLAKNATQPPAPPASGTSRFVTITDVQVSELCAAKVQLLPLCATDRYSSPNLPDGGSSSDGLCNVAIPLLQTPSAIYLVMDDSQVMHTAFGDKGYATAMSLSLADPVFQRTSAAFSFFSHKDVECPPTVATGYQNPTIAFDLAANAQAKIATALKAWSPPDMGNAAPAHLDLLAATQPTSGAYSAVQAYLAMRETPDVAGVMFFVNRVPGGTAPNPAPDNDCSVTSMSDATARLESDALSASSLSPSLQTFFVVVPNDQSDPGVFAFYHQLQLDHPDFITTLDATSADPNTVLANFSQVITRLGTCLYELPEGTDATTPLTVQYVNPLTRATVQIPKDATCGPSTQGSANGWNVDNGRLRICGNGGGGACDTLRGTIIAASAAAAASALPAPNVPVTTTLPCAPSTDAGLGGD